MWLLTQHGQGHRFYINHYLWQRVCQHSLLLSGTVITWWQVFSDLIVVPSLFQQLLLNQPCQGEQIFKIIGDSVLGILFPKQIVLQLHTHHHLVVYTLSRLHSITVYPDWWYGDVSIPLSPCCTLINSHLDPNTAIPVPGLALWSVTSVPNLFKLFSYHWLSFYDMSSTAMNTS